MVQERKTYESKKARYNLNPAKVFNVVADLEAYIRDADRQAMEDNPGWTRPSTGLWGHGRRLAILTEAVDEPGTLTSFSLAELVLSKDNTKLTLTTYEHPRAAIPSDELHDIAKKYQVK
jgi:hypothetical protein